MVIEKCPICGRNPKIKSCGNEAEVYCRNGFGLKKYSVFCYSKSHYENITFEALLKWNECARNEIKKEMI